MKQGDYIVILAPMVSELKLSGNNLIIFALIYGFSKDGFNKFEGSIDYICKWTNISRPTVISCLKVLVDCGYLNKEETTINNVKRCSYTTNYDNLIGGSKEICLPVKKLNLGSKETSPNIYNNNANDKSLSTINNKVNGDEIKKKWEELNPNLPSIRCFNEKRNKALKTLLKNNNATIDDLYKVFEVISACSFCQGNNDRKWLATLDWVLNDTKGCFNRLLEGIYAFSSSEKQKVQKITNRKQPTLFNVNDNDTTTLSNEKVIINGQIYR